MSAITRSVQAMDLLARKGPLGVRAVAQQLSLPLGSVHRLLLDLAEEGIVDRTASGEWELSYRLLQITGLHLERIELPHLFRPHAERIAQATGETVNLNALSNGSGVCIDKVRGNEGMQLDMRIGSRGPMHCGGAGKAMLAFMTPAEQQVVYASELAPLTAFTITDANVLRAEIGRTRTRGYSIDDQEVVIGVYCVAVPILDRNGYPAGSMSITGPSVKRPGPEIAVKVAMLNEACGAISRRLGYSGAWPPVAPTTAPQTV
jgi:IclR family acetate operon transcriptional repressor